MNKQQQKLQETAVTTIVLESINKLHTACSRYAHHSITKEEFVKHLWFCIESLNSYHDILAEEHMEIRKVKQSVQSQVSSSLRSNG